MCQCYSIGFATRKGGKSAGSTGSATNSKQAALEAAFRQIESEFGAGTVMRLNDTARKVVPAISTGSFLLDRALGMDQGVLESDFVS